jgi:hypothetical protein
MSDKIEWHRCGLMDGSVLIRDDRGNKVASIDAPSHIKAEWTERNTRLILAAPDLLAALEAVINSNLWHYHDDADTDRINYMVELAIKKAKGES